MASSSRYSKPYLLGIDVGTTHIKAVVFDEAGVEAARCSTDTPSLPGNGSGHVVWDPEAIWEAVASVTRRALKTLGSEAQEMARSGEAQPRPPQDPSCRTSSSGVRPEIVGVAVASVGESGVPLDREGRPLYPIIAWFDPRTAPQAAWWAREIGQERTRAITGLSVKSIYSALKILWLFENVSGLREAIDAWLPVSSYVAYRLTGGTGGVGSAAGATGRPADRERVRPSDYLVDFSQASRTLLFDQTKLDWSCDLAEAAGIPARILPRAVPSGTPAGYVSRETALATGLPAGVPVFMGGHDHVCGALAVGATRPGILLDSCGTAESILTSCPDASVLRTVCGNGFSLGHHVVEGMRYAMGGLLASGGAVEWFMREFLEPEPGASYERLTELARRSEPGAGGVVFVPRLLGSGPPTRDERATGAFARLRPGATRADFARSVFEGLSFELRTAIKAMEAALGTPVSSVVATGGGVRNDLWLAIKASVLGMPIEVPEVTEAAALGAALLAGIGCGMYRDVGDALARTLRIARRAEPDESLRELYEDAYSIYCSVSDALHRVDAALR
ncbi:MAG: FGGY family carbohydrate kinase [Firmicutes bacterium]|nr:FGGY family carbohydrate kinase [Bacillota bacterium]MDH7496399.1 FGGY family carbohydrate kinase [Bacillota bacterium]